ncbi:hypothetical protein BJX96DRAFT_182016 [Aspergillus floccosus]
MASLERKEETLKSIIRNSAHRYICPLCFKLFPRGYLLIHHIHEQKDDTHASLRMGHSKGRTDAEEFLDYYRKSVNTSVAAADIPPVPHCFGVNFLVEHYYSFPHARASLQRRVETLEKIIQVSYIDFVCPICLKGFPRPAVLYDHFRKQGEDADARPAERTAEEQWEMEMHAGLAKRTTRKQWDMEEFLTCYRQSVKTSMAAENIPPSSHCFEVNFVVEHYGENTGSQH